MRQTIIIVIILITLSLSITTQAFNVQEVLELVRHHRSHVTTDYRVLLAYIQEQGATEYTIDNSRFYTPTKVWTLGAESSYGWEGLTVMITGSWVVWGTFENGSIRDGYVFSNSDGRWEVINGEWFYI